MSPERKSFKFNFDEVVEIAKEAALRNGKHAPLLVAEGSRQGIIGYLDDIPETHKERARMMFATGYSIARSGAIGWLRQVFFVCEGWMTVLKEGNLPDVMPSQDPNRKEVLIVSAMQVEQSSKSLKLFEMVRNEDGGLVDLKEIIPSREAPSGADIPLLYAFVAGFQVGVREKVN